MYLPVPPFNAEDPENCFPPKRANAAPPPFTPSRVRPLIEERAAIRAHAAQAVAQLSEAESKKLLGAMETKWFEAILDNTVDQAARHYLECYIDALNDRFFAGEDLVDVVPAFNGAAVEEVVQDFGQAVDAHLAKSRQRQELERRNQNATSV